MTAIIRTALEDDAPHLAAIYAPYVLDTVISFESVPPDAQEFSVRMADCLKYYPWLIAEVDGRIVGYAYAGPHSGRAAYDWSANISVYLTADHHRRGIGRRLYDILIHILRHQGYHSLFAGITLPNSASVAIHTALGMKEVGIYREVGFKFGQWHDVMWMGMAISASTEPSEKPTPFPLLGDLQNIVPGLQVTARR
ncbi:N-acetyltransferase [Sphingobium sp. TomTYG75]